MLCINSWSCTFSNASNDNNNSTTCLYPHSFSRTHAHTHIAHRTCNGSYAHVLRVENVMLPGCCCPPSWSANVAVFVVVFFSAIPNVDFNNAISDYAPTHTQPIARCFAERIGHRQCNDCSNIPIGLCLPYIWVCIVWFYTYNTLFVKKMCLCAALTICSTNSLHLQQPQPLGMQVCLRSRQPTIVQVNSRYICA